MNVLITGGTGFVGTHVSERLLNLGHSVTAVGTRKEQNRIGHADFHYISADTTRPGDWQTEITRSDAVINLAGKNIFKRWNAQFKQEIYDSRVLTTRNVVAALPQDRPVVLCSASAVGYYGDRGDEILDEDAEPGKGFLCDVGRDWEKEAAVAEEKGHRVALMRFGVILGRGGALEKMLPAFKGGVGGPLGNGRQWFPWMHIDDLVSAVVHLLENDTLKGPFNFSAPSPVRNAELAQTLGRIVKRPSFLTAPGFMLRLVLGQVAETLLDSTRAMPVRLQQSGYQFKFAELKPALQDLVAK